MNQLGADDFPWVQSKCGGIRWRQLPDLSVELEGKGIVTSSDAEWKSRTTFFRKKTGRKGSLDDWKDLIFKYSQKYEVPAHWIAAIVAFESNADPLASSGQATGLMQLTLPTAASMAKAEGLPAPSVSMLASEPELNLRLGVRYLRDCLKRNAWQFPLAAVSYNAGSVICGTGCEKKPVTDESGKVKWKCVNPCPPNEWGMVMDCARNGDDLVSSNYPTGTVRLANYALTKGGYGPAGASQVLPVGPKPVIRSPIPIVVDSMQNHWGLWLLAAVGGAVGGALIGGYVSSRSYSRRR